jgi:hypothetical protein
MFMNMFDVPKLAHLSWSLVGSVKSKIITKIDAKSSHNIVDGAKNSNPIHPRGSSNNASHLPILKGDNNDE